MFGHCGNSLLEAEADSSCVSSSNFSAVICGAEFYSGGAALAGSASAANSQGLPPEVTAVVNGD